MPSSARLALSLVFLALAFLAGLAVGRALPSGVPVMQDGDVVLRRVADWIEVHRDGDLAEWRREDGAPFHVLDIVMRGEWHLLPEPMPAVGDGREV